MAVALGLATVIVAPVLIKAATTDCHLFSVDGSSYSRANRAVLETVPVFPDSTLINTGSMGRQYQNRCFALGDTGPPYASFETYVNYETPASAGPQDVLDFYNRYFAGEGWHAESVIFPGVAGSDVTYTDGVRRVTMRVVVQGYSLTADHDTTD